MTSSVFNVSVIRNMLCVFTESEMKHSTVSLNTFVGGCWLLHSVLFSDFSESTGSGYKL